MKKTLMFAALLMAVASLSGCNTCRQMTSGWFNKGDRCCPPPPPSCPPGAPQATMMLPTTPQVLPGAIEVAPTF